MTTVRSRALILAALLAPGLAIAVSCSLAGLAEPPQASSSSSSGSGGGDAGTDGSAGDADAGVADADLVFCAADAQLFGHYVTGYDVEAGLGYVVVPAEAGACTSDDYLILNVSVNADGTYQLYTRAYGTGIHNDTFFVQADMGPTYMYRTSQIDKWVDEAISNAQADVSAPLQYEWEAGPQQIIVACRSVDVLINCFWLQQISH